MSAMWAEDSKCLILSVVEAERDPRSVRRSVVRNGILGARGARAKSARRRRAPPVYGPSARNLTDLFAVQDEITRSIVVTVAPEVEVAEMQRVRRAGPETLGPGSARCALSGISHA